MSWMDTVVTIALVKWDWNWTLPVLTFMAYQHIWSQHFAENAFGVPSKSSICCRIVMILFLAGSLILWARLPSVTLVNCDHRVQCTADILTLHERAITLVFWHEHCLVGDAPSHLKFALKALFVNLCQLYLTYMHYL